MTVKTDVVKGTEATEPVDVERPGALQRHGRLVPAAVGGLVSERQLALAVRRLGLGRAPGMTDRVSMLWPMTAVTTFESKGCYAACHRPAAGADASEKPYMILPGADEQADNWQWTASTGPQNQVSDRTLQGVLANPAHRVGVRQRQARRRRHRRATRRRRRTSARSTCRTRRSRRRTARTTSRRGCRPARHVEDQGRSTRPAFDD